MSKTIPIYVDDRFLLNKIGVPMIWAKDGMTRWIDGQRGSNTKELMEGSVLITQNQFQSIVGLLGYVVHKCTVRVDVNLKEEANTNLIAATLRNYCQVEYVDDLGIIFHCGNDQVFRVTGDFTNWVRESKVVVDYIRFSYTN